VTTQFENSNYLVLRIYMVQAIKIGYILLS